MADNSPSGDDKSPVIDLGKTFFDSHQEEDKKFQLNPSSAMTHTTSSDKHLKQNQILPTLVGMLAVVAVIATGQYVIRTAHPSINAEASVNLKQTLSGTVGSIDKNHQSFTLWYQDSLDLRVRSANIMQWSVHLPPGTTFDSSISTQQDCQVVADVRKNLSEAKPMRCRYVVIPGREVLVEYVVIQPEKASMVAKTIIGNALP